MKNQETKSENMKNCEKSSLILKKIDFEQRLIC